MIDLICPGPGNNLPWLQYHLAPAAYGTRHHGHQADHDEVEESTMLQPLDPTLDPKFAAVEIDLARLTKILDSMTSDRGPKNDEVGGDTDAGRAESTDENTTKGSAENNPEDSGVVNKDPLENIAKVSLDGTTKDSGENTPIGALPRDTRNKVLHRLDEFAPRIAPAATERYKTLQTSTADEATKQQAHKELHDLYYLLNARETMINERFDLLAQRVFGPGLEAAKMAQLSSYHFWGTVLVPDPIKAAAPALEDESDADATTGSDNIRNRCWCFSSWELPINVKLARMTRLLCIKFGVNPAADNAWDREKRMQKRFWALGASGTESSHGGSQQDGDSEQVEPAAVHPQSTAPGPAEAPARLEDAPVLSLDRMNPCVREPSLTSPLPFRPPMPRSAQAVLPHHGGPPSGFPAAAQRPCSDGLARSAADIMRTTLMDPAMSFFQPTLQQQQQQQAREETVTYTIVTQYRIGARPDLVPDEDQTRVPPGWARSTQVITETVPAGGSGSRDYSQDGGNHHYHHHHYNNGSFDSRFYSHDENGAYNGFYHGLSAWEDLASGRVAGDGSYRGGSRGGGDHGAGDHGVGYHGVGYRGGDPRGSYHGRGGYVGNNNGNPALGSPSVRGRGRGGRGGGPRRGRGGRGRGRGGRGRGRGGGRGSSLALAPEAAAEAAWAETYYDPDRDPAAFQTPRLQTNFTGGGLRSPQLPWTSDNW